MPKLLLFLPCEKVIIAQGDNNPTLVGVLSEIRGEFEIADAPAQTPPFLPFRWQVFTMWGRESSDEGKTFESQARLVSPSGKLALRSESSFTVIGVTHRDTGELQVLPVAERGIWKLELYLRAKGVQSWPEAPLATYPIVIELERRSSLAPVPA